MKKAIVIAVLAVATVAVILTQSPRRLAVCSRTQRAGQVWLYPQDNNPFDDWNSADTNTVLATQDGWVKYQCEYTYHGTFYSVTKSKRNDWFLMGSKLVRDAEVHAEDNARPAVVATDH